MNFREDESSFSLEAIPLKLSQQLNAGLWLVLVGINEIPPHIALVFEGKYYSISTRKVDNGSSLERFLEILSRKNIPCIFIRIETKSKVSTTIVLRNEAISLKLQLEHIYKDLQPLQNSELTCLSPIKEFFTAYFSKDFSNTNYVFELLALADRKGLISDCLSLNTSQSESNHITLPKYTKAQIRNKISMLSIKSEISFLIS